MYLNSLKYLRSSSNSSRCFLIFSSFIFNSYGGSFKSSLSWLYRRKAPSKSSRGFTLCFQLLFLFIILLLPEFFMVVLYDLIHSFKSSSRFLLAEFKYLFFSHLEVQLILRILLKWSFAFLRCSQLSKHFRLWPVITLWSWDVTYKTTTSLFFSLLIVSTTPFNPSF